MQPTFSPVNAMLFSPSAVVGGITETSQVVTSAPNFLLLNKSSFGKCDLLNSLCKHIAHNCTCQVFSHHKQSGAK